MQPYPNSRPGGCGARPRLLIVDDNAVNIRVLREIFKDDHDIFIATGGQQALALCAEVQPDLVLLDVVMPDVDGHAVCRQLKADPRTSAIPVIFLTAQHDEADEVVGFQLGAVDFIAKPVNQVIVRARVATHLALKRQADQLKSMALVDGLTGLANRRRFDEELPLAWAHCARTQAPFSLLMIDVDHFKRYNDCYGHQQGDDCLRAVAGAIRGIARRPYDLAARYGGEEFCCLLPDTAPDQAMQLAQQAADAVRALGIAHAASDTAPVVTVSIGLATTVPASGHMPLELVAAADQQLYRAKQQGRARVCAVCPV